MSMNFVLSLERDRGKEREREGERGREREREVLGFLLPFVPTLVVGAASTTVRIMATAMV